MIAVMKKTLPVTVLDVGMPVRRSNVRHDLRLVCQLIRDEYENRVDENTIDQLCERLNLRKGGWRRISEEAGDVHGLWADGVLTRAGQRCADDGVVLDFEDGPHRIWFIQDELPIGLQVIHIASWGDLEIDNRIAGRPYNGTAFASIRDSGRTYQSAMEQSVRCIVSPPKWWLDIAKREPHVQEQPEYSSQITLQGEIGDNDRSVQYSVSGELLGLGRNRTTLSENPWRPAGVDVLKATVDQAVDVWLSRQMPQGMTWDSALRRVNTSPRGLESYSIEQMTMDVSLEGFAMVGVGMWEGFELRDVPVAPVDLKAACEWVARLFWMKSPPVHRFWSSFEAQVGSILKDERLSHFVSLEAVSEGALDEAIADPELGAPQGAHWLFNAAADLGVGLAEGGAQ